MAASGGVLRLSDISPVLRSADQPHVSEAFVVVVSKRYHRVVAMTLRLTDDEHGELEKRAANDGVSMQEVARRAIREYVGLADHRDRVVASAQRIMLAHAEAIDRPGR